jgi:integrase
MGTLNPKEIDTLLPGTWGDGNNLYLVVKNAGARSYLLRYRWRGRPQKMGLGSARNFKLAEARKAAIAANRLIARGINPREARDEKRRATNTVLFGDFAEKFRLMKETGFRHEHHKAKWKYNIQVRCKALHEKRIDLISNKDVLAIIAPIWLTTPVAASDMRQQLEAILSAAKAAGHRSGDNPAAWKDNLQHLLPKARRKGKVRGPHKALAYEELPNFMLKLAVDNSVSARMLEICILTCARTNEIVNMRWSDIDLDRAIWTLPRDLMKMDRDHIVPLSQPVISFLRSPGTRSGEFVFPGRNRGKPMSNMVLLSLLKRMRANVTTHGFRATFRTWADEEMNFSNQAVEFCLAHVPGDNAEKAYRRRSMLKTRVQIMAMWAAFAKGGLLPSS